MISSILRQRAERQAQQVACTFLGEDLEPRERLTYAELERRARAIAVEVGWLASRGDRALLLYPPGLDFVAAFFGCAYAGVVAVPVDVPRPGRGSPRLEAIAGDARPALVLTTATLAARLAPDAPGRLHEARWLATDRIDPGAADAWSDPGCTAADVALLQYTSGSTSTPKGAVLTHANLLANSERVGRHFGHDASSHVASWLPHFHDMGLIGTILHPILYGFPTTLMSPLAFVQKPSRWLKMISKVRATTSGAPNFAYDLCVRRVKSSEKAELDLRSWEVAFNGAEPVRQETLERFAEAFAGCGLRRESLFPCYGLAEATLLVAGGPKGVAPRWRQRPHAAGAPVVSCGPPTDARDVAIVDPETLAPRPAGEIGEIWLCGPCVANGYWGRASESAALFGARLPGDPRGPFLRTGDLGFIADGELYVSGRLKDTIIIAGINHQPEDVERTVDESHPWLDTGRCVVFAVEQAGEERLVVGIELQRGEWAARSAPGEGRRARRPAFDAERLVEDVRQAVVRHHGVRVHEVVMLAPGALARTTSGKVQRQLCRLAYESGDWQRLADGHKARRTPAPAGASANGGARR